MIGAPTVLRSAKRRNRFRRLGYERAARANYAAGHKGAALFWRSPRSDPVRCSTRGSGNS